MGSGMSWDALEWWNAASEERATRGETRRGPPRTQTHRTARPAVSDRRRRAMGREEPWAVPSQPAARSPQPAAEAAAAPAAPAPAPAPAPAGHDDAAAAARRAAVGGTERSRC